MKYNTLFRVLTIGEEVGPANRVILKIILSSSDNKKDKDDLISRMVSHTRLIKNMSDLNKAWKLIKFVRNTNFDLESEINFDKMNISDTIEDFKLYDDDYNEIQYEKE